MKQVIIITFILGYFYSCTTIAEKEYNYPRNTFLEQLESPFKDEIFTHCDSNFNFMDYLFVPTFERDSILDMYVASANSKDTSDFKIYHSYIFNKTDKFLGIDTKVESYKIIYNERNQIDRIKNNEPTSLREIEAIYKDNQLVRLNSYWNNVDRYLDGYCRFENENNRIAEEFWYDVSDENAKEILNRRVVYKYDYSNRLARKNVYNNEDELIRKIYYNHEIETDIVTDILFNSAKDSIANMYIYDKQKRLLSKKSLSHNMIVDSLIYKIIPNGFLIEERTYKSNEPIGDFVKITKVQSKYLGIISNRSK